MYEKLLQYVFICNSFIPDSFIEIIKINNNTYNVVCAT